MPSKRVLVFVALGVTALMASEPTRASEVTANVTVPSSSLIFDGPGLMPPDATGHFAVGIKLPQKAIKAQNCETPYVVVGIGTLNKAVSELTSSEKTMVEGNARFFAKLKSSPSGSDVTLPVRNSSLYATKRRGIIIAKYCSLSIDQDRVR